MRYHIALTVMLTTLLGPGVVAHAGPKDFAIYATRLGGDSAAAAPYIAKFNAYVEEALKWPKGSLKGVFFDNKREVTGYIKSTRPGLGVLEPQLYFELRAAEKLVPLAQLESKDIVSPKLHVVVKDPALTSLDGLKGKKLWTLLAESPVYLSKVVLAGKVDATTHFSLKRIGTAGKGVRAVLLGSADATVLDDDQLSEAKKMQGGAKLRSIYVSPALPPLPLVAFGTSLPAKDVKALVGVLLKMCSSQKGGPICKDMRITRFAPVNAALFKDAQKRYEAK